MEGPFEPDLSRAVDAVMELMAIPGKSCQEKEAASYVVDKLRAAGAPESAIQFDSAHRRTPQLGQTGNLVFKLPGSHRGPRRMFSAHLDTVPLCVGSKPVRKGNFVTSAAPGRALGADDRAGVAAVLCAALEILERSLPHPPLTFLWPVQEEIGLQGVRQLSTSLLGRPKLAFNWDGGSPYKITVGATGGYRLAIEVDGIASHAGVAPQSGVSAITIASVAIARLHRDGWLGLIEKPEGMGTSNIGVIQSGDATNVVADKAHLRAEARSHDPKFRGRIVKAIESAFKDAVKEVKNDRGAKGKMHFDGRLDYESFLLANDEPCVLEAEAAVRSLGHEPERAIAMGGLDANWLAAHGIPTVSLGCGQLRQHMADEALDIDQFHDACRLTLRLATARL